LQHAPSRGITRTDSPHKRGHYGEQVTEYLLQYSEEIVVSPDELGILARFIKALGKIGTETGDVVDLRPDAGNVLICAMRNWKEFQKYICELSGEIVPKPRLKCLSGDGPLIAVTVWEEAGSPKYKL
jgi:hypothetical protein